MDEAVIKRILPHSAEAEQSVIGAMLMDKEAISVASEILVGEDFYERRYGLVFDAIVDLFSAGKAVDIVTLQNRLKEKDAPPELTDMEFVKSVLRSTPTSANVKHYAEIVREKSVLRDLIRETEMIGTVCYQDNEPLDDILETAEKTMFRIFERRGVSSYVPIRKIVIEALDVIERASKTHGRVTGIPTGFTDLDYRTSGLQNSDLILVAARPSMGKTAFVLNMAEYMAFKQDKAVAIFSLEMSRLQLMNRLFAMQARVNSQNLRNGNLREEEWNQLIETAGVIGESKLIIDDTPGITVRELRSKCRKYKMEHGLDIVMIDYLQLMTGGGSRGGENRQQEVSEISRSLKSLARELNVPIVALSQLSRAVEQRTGDHRPILSDLRESGAIEQDADVVMFLYRDDYYNKDNEKLKGICEVIVAKQRNGPIGTVNLAWLPDYTKFMNLERKHNWQNEKSEA